MILSIYASDYISDDQIIQLLKDYLELPYDLTFYNNKLKIKKRHKKRNIDIDKSLLLSLKKPFNNKLLKIERIIEAIITQRGDELFYNAKLFSDKNVWIREVVTPVGRIDGLNKVDKIIVELKFIDGWKSALGQILCYNWFFKFYKREIWLLKNRPFRKKEELYIKDICFFYDVNVKFIDV